MRPSFRSLSSALRNPPIANHPLSPRTASIGFLGLGRMGSEMAFNLFSKHHQAHLINNSTANNNGTSSSSSRSDASFVVCDAVPESAQAFARKFLSQFPGANIRIVDTPDQVVLASQTIITMLPSSPQMKEVYTGERGVLSVLNNDKLLSPEQVKSTLCIDSTTLDVDVARQVAEVVTRTGAQMVDAPVSGGVHAASQSTLAFLVGGPHTSYTLSLPYLTLMGSPPKIIHCGEKRGSGLAAKLVNNLILGVQQAVVGEGMLVGVRMGADPKVLVDVVGCSTGGCWAVGRNNPVRGALVGSGSGSAVGGGAGAVGGGGNEATGTTGAVEAPCERDYEGGFALELMLKDMKLASEAARRTGTPLPIGGAAERLYEKVLREREDFRRKDFSVVYKYLEEKEGSFSVDGDE